MTTCTHEYRIPSSGGRDFCLGCKSYVDVRPEPPDDEQTELVMPPRIFELTESLWRIVTPWPLLPFELAKRNMWYISMLNGIQYLVMPVMKGELPIYFSARKLLAKEFGPKYLYPKGVKKSYWVSDDSFRDPVILCEGVADAAYCSVFGTSVAVLGSYYNGSLDHKLRYRHVAVCFDCDAAGTIAALRIMTQLKDVASKKIVMLPYKKDPNDIPVERLRELIFS